MNRDDAPRTPLTSKPLPGPGDGLDRRLLDVSVDKVLVCVVLAAVAWALWLQAAIHSWVGRVPDPHVYLAIAAIVTVICAALCRRGWAEMRRLKQGRDGERIVGQVLQSLDLPGLRVYHDVPADGFNLDHVVVCERGIYVVETKTWSKRAREKLRTSNGRIFLGNRPAPGDAVGQAAAEARWIRELLVRATGVPYRCQPVVAVPGWYGERMDAATKSIAWVLEPKALRGWIERDKICLSLADIARIDHAIVSHIRQRVEA